jgi:hypothetical protein
MQALSLIWWASSMGRFTGGSVLSAFETLTRNSTLEALGNLEQGSIKVFHSTSGLKKECCAARVE